MLCKIHIKRYLNIENNNMSSDLVVMERAVICDDLAGEERDADDD